MAVWRDGPLSWGERMELVNTLRREADEKLNERFLVEKGMRVAQLVVQPYVSVEFQQVDELGVTGRGTDGFGSSGK